MSRSWEAHIWGESHRACNTYLNMFKPPENITIGVYALSGGKKTGF